eukprot:CAMPEP_0195303506 /NCGR_PEP_ID=MMETSP0707-20130614/32909_1 /TAXON_ID=33640 /ORGANISM="Asterionellopsis glacialis, Strain CCMP134" /LENGTH=172 /DNA_ID=CAMNT_0040367085 /DNA_START=63 /DNA_END=578 /DNA_ORIENTATION=+
MTCIDEICRTLSENDESMTTLKLYCIRLGDDGAKKLGSMLPLNHTLQSMILYGNSIGDEGITSIAKGLERNGSIHTVFIYGNRIGDSGAKAIGRMLKINKGIRSLNLTRDRMGELGKKEIVEGLRHNFHLEYCDIDPSLQNHTDYYSKLNRGGRRLLRDHGVSNSLWATILG